MPLDYGERQQIASQVAGEIAAQQQLNEAMADFDRKAFGWSLKKWLVVLIAVPIMIWLLIAIPAAAVGFAEEGGMVGVFIAAIFLAFLLLKFTVALIRKFFIWFFGLFGFTPDEIY